MKKNWFSWSDLLDHWGMVGDELLQELKKGLQPYYGIKDHEIMCCPYKYHPWKFLKDRLDEIEDLESKLVGDPNYKHYQRITLEELKAEKKDVNEQFHKIKNTEDINCLSWKNLGPLTPKLRKELFSEMENAIFKVADVTKRGKKISRELKNGKNKTIEQDLFQTINPSIKDKKMLSCGWVKIGLSNLWVNRLLFQISKELDILSIY